MPPDGESDSPSPSGASTQRMPPITTATTRPFTARPGSEAVASLLMERTGQPSTDGDPMDWNGLMGRLLHDSQVLVIEALKWIGQPLSSKELENVFEESLALSSVCYHVVRLAELGVLERVGERPVRGAWEHFYFFVGTEAD
jgi:hypothetical protein